MRRRRINVMIVVGKSSGEKECAKSIMEKKGFIQEILYMQFALRPTTTERNVVETPRLPNAMCIHPCCEKQMQSRIIYRAQAAVLLLNVKQKHTAVDLFASCSPSEAVARRSSRKYANESNDQERSIAVSLPTMFRQTSLAF